MASNAPDDEQSTTVVQRPPSLGAVASGVVSLLLVASVHFVPVLNLLIAPLGLIPVVRFLGTGERGIRAWGWVVLLLALATGSRLVPFAPTLLAAYLLIVVLPAVTIEAWCLLRWSEGRWAAVAVLASACMSMAAVGILVWPSAPTDGTGELIREEMAQVGFEEALRSSGTSRGEVDLQLDLLENVFSWILPSAPVAYVTMVLFWIRPRLALLGVDAPVATFEDYHSDEWLPAVFALSGMGTLVLSGTSRWMAVNLLVAVLILYFVHGLAIIRAHLARWVGRGWAVRWGVGLLSLQVPFCCLVAVLGLVDSFVRLRPRTDGQGRDS